MKVRVCLWVVFVLVGGPREGEREKASERAKASEKESERERASEKEREQVRG